jgi:hypothetical protein
LIPHGIFGQIGTKLETDIDPAMVDVSHWGEAEIR